MNAHRIFMGKYLGECPHGRQRRRMEDNIKLDLME
jgi:hypothetical protein